MSFNPEHLNTYPLDPGVYLMKNREGKVIYVGKANSLKKRLKQYFARTKLSNWKWFKQSVRLRCKCKNLFFNWSLFRQLLACYFPSNK